MRLLRNFSVSLACLLAVFSANAQGINSVAVSPNPAFTTSFVTASIEYFLPNACWSFVGQNNFWSGTTLNVYVDFDNSGDPFCAQVYSTGTFGLNLGFLSANNYTIKIWDVDTGMLLFTKNFSVFPPGNGNSCNNPVSLACGNSYSGTNAGGSNTFSVYTNSGGANVFSFETGPEAVHTFTVASPTNVQINLTGLSADLDLMLNSSCSPNFLLNYSGNGGSSSEYITQTLPAGTYTIIVDGYSGAVSNYVLSLTCNPPNVCGTPMPGQLFASNITTSTARLNNSMTGVSSYQFRIKRSTSLNWVMSSSSPNNFINVSNLQACTNYDFQARVFCNGTWSDWSATKVFTSLCNSPCFNAIDLACGSIFSGNTLNTVNAWSSYSCINWDETGGECVFRVVLNQPGNLSAALSGMGNFNGDVFILGACSNANCLAFGDNFTTLPNAPAGTYYVVVDGRNGQAGYFTLSINCNGTTTSSDEPCGATLLQVNNSCVLTNASNVGATTTQNPLPNTGCNNTGMQDVWFKFVMPSNGRVNLNTYAGTLTNAIFAAYRGPDCNYLTYFGCVDNSGNNPMPQAIITGTPGQTYFLRLWGYGGQTGTFSLCLTTCYSKPGSNVGAELAAISDLTAERSENLEPSWAESPLEISLHPVPATDHLTVSLNLPSATDLLDIWVFDMTAKIVLSETGLRAEAGAFTRDLNIADLPIGSFVVKVRAGESVLTSKFVKVE